MNRKIKAVILDGYTENPGDLNWDYLESVFNLTVYDRTPKELVIERAKNAGIKTEIITKNSFKFSFYGAFIAFVVTCTTQTSKAP